METIKNRRHTQIEMNRVVTKLRQINLEWHLVHSVTESLFQWAEDQHLLSEC